MRLVGYYALHTFWNSVRKIFRSTFLAIFFGIIIIGGIFGVATGVIFSSIEDEYAVEISQGEDGNYYDEDGNLVDEDGNLIDENGHLIDEDGNLIDEDGNLVDENGNIIEEEMSAEDVAAVKMWVEAGAELLIIVFMLWGIYTGSKKGSDIFLMADVNFLFTAPIKPQSVLMFRLMFQMAAMLVGSIYLVFQIPNLVINAGLDGYAVAAIFLAWIFLLIFQKLVSVLTYTLTSTYEKTKQYVVPIVIFVASALVVLTGSVFLSTGRDVMKTLEVLYTPKWSRMIPMIGWYKALIITAVNGELLATLGYAILLLVGMGLLIFFIWHIKADFYEDALEGAAKREEMVTAAAEGRKVATKERSKKISREGTLRGEGASVFLQKEIYTRKRLARFGFLTNTMLLYLATAVLTSLFCIKVEAPGYPVVGFILMGIVFFRNYGNPIAAETSMNYLFLVPENPYKKVFYAMAAGTYACVLDLLPGIVIAMLLLKENPGMVLLWLLVLVSMDFMLSTVGMLIEFLVPNHGLDTVKAMVQMMLKFFMILIIVLLFVVGMVIGGMVGGLLVTFIGSLVVGGIIFVIYPTMLHEGTA
ncbi:MAG: putative ABC exporter domain-containing protein [Roseburia sp.]